ncbi:hypothetical protein LOTGIDRAFT_201542 [Lottia gigantea]|uniref:Uncharacterized protein n=1 Tax=Lottia gigantea TaxID=225164 RepID=V4AUP0_LOTGI|nr:hypothetical protein LOTGIDRAFT_201542 [Lottia gigantea]ESO98660.1 hypothetical protein LOTGIDRAFT_201542 [Lottia gigantea]
MILLKHRPSQVLNICRSYSSIKTTDISKHFKLREISRSVPGKPLVILFDWLYAKPSAVDKYCNLYHDRGLDVLTVRGKVSQFLWPPKSFLLTEDLLKYLLETRPFQKYVIHAFSIGAYNYDVCMYLANQNKEKYGEFSSRIQGQILDSITIGTYEQMSRGVSSILPSNPIIRKSTMKIVDTYYKLTSKKTLKQYDILVQFFKNDPIRVPTLFFYAKNDPMCHVESIEEMIEKWREMDELEVFSRHWDESVHCAHLKYHQDEYLQELDDFLKTINL